MEDLSGYQSSHDEETESPKNVQKSYNNQKSAATLDAEWADFTRLIGESAFALEKSNDDHDDTQDAREKKIGSDRSPNSGSQHSSRASSRSKKSSSRSRSRSHSSSATSSNSRSPSPVDKKPCPKLTHLQHLSRSDSSSSERESPGKRRSSSPEAKVPRARKYRSRSHSHSPKRSRSRKSRERSRSKERTRRKRSRERKYSRSSSTKSPSRRHKSRSRSRDHRKHRKHSRSRSRSHGRKRSRSHERRRRRPRRKSRSRSSGRKHYRSRWKSSRSRSRDRHHRRREHRRRSRSRGKDSHKTRGSPDDSSRVKKKNEPLTFKEKLKQSLMDIQKQAAKGELVINSESSKALELMSANEKPSTLPLNLKNQFANLIPSGSQVTPQVALIQTMAAMHQKAQELTGVAVPKYYNPAAVNPLKYAEQVQKRKLLWSKNKETAKPEISDADIAAPSTSGTVWEGTKFAQDQDGKVSAKFRKLMGIKQDSTDAGEETVKNEKAEELSQKHAELFSRLDQEYEFARMTTHTHRGVGLGFASQGMPDI